MGLILLHFLAMPRRRTRNRNRKRKASANLKRLMNAANVIARSIKEKKKKRKNKKLNLFSYNLIGNSPEYNARYKKT